MMPVLLILVIVMWDVYMKREIVIMETNVSHTLAIKHRDVYMKLYLLMTKMLVLTIAVHQTEESLILKSYVMISQNVPTTVVIKQLDASSHLFLAMIMIYVQLIPANLALDVLMNQ
jgi:transcription initiation factor IIE alpha subunit